MLDKEIIKLWRSGLSKDRLAKIYKRRYNARIKIIRSEVPNRHVGKFITEFEALHYVEKIILNFLKKERKSYN